MRFTARARLETWAHASRVHSDEVTYDLERTVVGSVVAGVTADRCGQCGACDRSVVSVAMGDRETGDMEMMGNDMRAERAKQAEPNWQSVPPRSCIKPTHEAADAFWNYWKANGETHKHGYYESTWGAINAALACGYTAPPADDEAVRLLREARQCVHEEASYEREIEGRGYYCELVSRIDAYLARVGK